MPPKMKKPAAESSGRGVTKATARKSAKDFNGKKAQRLENINLTDQNGETGERGHNVGHTSNQPVNVDREAVAGNSSEREVINYLLLCHMNCSFNPTITRLLSVPSTTKFDLFHGVMQVAFGWANCHAYQFTVMPIPKKEGAFISRTSALLRITTHSEDDVISSWDRCPRKHMEELTLGDIFENEEYKDTKLLYEYDFGDSWEHNILCIGRETASTRRALGVPEKLGIACLAGEGHPCAEDVGAEPGWESLKELFAKPRMKDEDGRRQWYKTTCANGDPKGLDPYKWDVFEVNRQLAELQGFFNERENSG